MASACTIIIQLKNEEITLSHRIISRESALFNMKRQQIRPDMKYVHTPYVCFYYGFG